MGPDTIWIFIPVTALLIPIAAIVTGHFQKMAEIKARAGTNLSAEVRAELGALRDQIELLRDTTSKFDLSFDAALTRLEGRMDSVETRVDAPVGIPVVPTASQIAEEYATPRRVAVGSGASNAATEAETTTRRVALRR